MAASNSTSHTSKRGAPKGNKNAFGHGAPRGNKNAVKHGFYSRWFTGSEEDGLEQDILGKLENEDHFLATFIARLFTSMQHEKMDFDHYIVALRVVSLVMGRKASLHRSRKAFFANLSAMEQVMQELKSLPAEEF